MLIVSWPLPRAQVTASASRQPGIPSRRSSDVGGSSDPVNAYTENVSSIALETRHAKQDRGAFVQLQLDPVMPSDQTQKPPFQFRHEHPSEWAPARFDPHWGHTYRGYWPIRDVSARTNPTVMMNHSPSISAPSIETRPPSEPICRSGIGPYRTT